MNLIEKLARLEHDQWVQWSQTLANTETLSEERHLRWKGLWVPYAKLTEKQKAQDRKWARKVLRIIRNEYPTVTNI